MDINAIEKLIAALERSELNYLEYQDERIRLVLGRDARGDGKTFTEHSSVGERGFAPSASAGERDGREETVRSPIVGSVYRSSDPETEPFVSVGKRVNTGDVIGLIEAMKMFSEIKAPCGGTVKEILFQDGALAEFGTPLFIIEKE